jgi:hypothetical protein
MTIITSAGRFLAGVSTDGFEPLTTESGRDEENTYANMSLRYVGILMILEKSGIICLGFARLKISIKTSECSSFAKSFNLHLYLALILA